MLKILDQLIGWARRISRWGAWFGGGLILLAAVVVAFDVIIRELFTLPVGGTDELSGFALAIASAFAFSYALLERAHVRIDSVYTNLPMQIRAFLDVVGLVVFTLFMTLLTWQAYGVFAESVRNSTVTLSAFAWPLRFPQFVWIVGLSWFVVVAALLLLRSLLTLMKGDWGTVQRQIGSKTVQEELEEELELAEKRQKQYGTGADE
jgi:TRAP-type mannitol/chloroaromatic compound transport system permease small subunit